MTQTSEERREVAERLKAYPLESVKADHKGKDPLQLPADVMYDLMDIAGVGEDFDSLLPSLADLIDPTCEVVPFDEESMRLPHCSRCGEPMLKPWPNFCPHCGARVTGGGERR